MSNETRLTPTSYIVLGLLEAAGESTPYDLKRVVAVSLGNFWSLQHAQLYTEPERLTAAGYLSERREEGGRRRKHYKITAKGREALGKWVAEPTEELTELRDPSMLKIFFGADPRGLAEGQLRVHGDKLREYEEVVERAGAELPSGARMTLEAGIGHEREWVRFWTKYASEAEGS